MLRTVIRVEGPSPDAAAARVDAAAESVFREGLRRVAERARGDHVFRNRTGFLEASIGEGAVSGSFSAGTMEGEVNADADYAEHVVARTGDDFIARAAEAEAERMADDLADAVLAALEAGD